MRRISMSDNQIDYTKTRFYAITSLVLTAVSIAVTIGLGILSMCLVRSINNTISSYNNNQEVVTLQPREGDVIIQEDGSYKLLQLIKIEDIEFTPILQETRFNKDVDVENRVDLFNINNQDWSNRVSFGYTIEKISINADKIMNLYNNIESIVVYIDIYESIDITSKVDLSDEDAFRIVIFEHSDNHITNTVINASSQKKYVTNAPGVFSNNGVNFAKLRLEIKYKINEMLFSSTVLSNEWLSIREN